MFIIQKFSRVGIEKLIDFMLKTFKTTASSLNSVAFLFYSSSRLSHPTLLLFSLPFFRIESANGVNDVLITFDFMSKITIPLPVFNYTLRLVAARCLYLYRKRNKYRLCLPVENRPWLQVSSLPIGAKR